MLSMIVQLDNMTRYAELLTMPNGTRSFPARSCCDLKEQYPDIPSGMLSRDDHSVDTFSVKPETQGRIGLIQTEGALLMHSKLTVTTRTTAVPLASMQRHG